MIKPFLKYEVDQAMYRMLHYPETIATYLKYAFYAKVRFVTYFQVLIGSPGALQRNLDPLILK